MRVRNFGFIGGGGGSDCGCGHGETSFGLGFGLGGGDEDFGDQAVFRDGFGVVAVVFDGEVGAEHHVAFGNEFPDATGGLRQVGVGAGEDELLYFPPERSS